MIEVERGQTKETTTQSLLHIDRLRRFCFFVVFIRHTVYSRPSYLRLSGDNKDPARGPEYKRRRPCDRDSLDQASAPQFIPLLEPWDALRNPTWCTNAEMRSSPRRRSLQSSSARGSFGRTKPPARATAQVKLVPRHLSSSAAALTVDLDNIPNAGPSRQPTRVRVPDR